MISASCGTKVKHICQEFKGIDKKKTSGESAKLSTTKNCRGAQANLKALPTC